MVPSLDDVMSIQNFVVSAAGDVSSVHVAPESVEVQMFPNCQTAAASLVPSLEEVMHRHHGVPAVPAVVAPTTVQLAPESVEAQMFPPGVLNSTAASLVPPFEEVIAFHGRVPPMEVISVQVYAYDVVST